jgi:general transcription factor IIIA
MRFAIQYSRVKPPKCTFSDRLMSLATTTVLGKRKNKVTSETLLLQLSASESNHDQSDVSRYEPESEAESRQALQNSGRKSEFVLVNGSLVKNAKKKFHCTFSGCDKSYSKPCRLEEHERSHTGEVSLSF